MNLFEVVILNIMYIAFPILAYLIYVAYNNNHSRRTFDIFLDLALFTAVYCVIRFGVGPFGKTPVLFANIPLLIAYMKNRRDSILILSLVLSIYSYKHYGGFLLYYFVEYGFYYLIYKLAINRKVEERKYILYFILVKSILHLWVVSETRIIEMLRTQDGAKNLFIILTFMIIGVFITSMFKEGEAIMKYHHTIKELEQEKQMRDSLFKITHEIKNPIAVCKGYLDMFDVNNTDHARRYVPIMKEEIARTLILLQDFLAMTKIKINTEIMDINLLIEDVMNSFSTIISKNNIKGTISLPDDEIYINGDYNRLCQVMINIVKNGIESMEKIHNGVLNVELKDSENNIIITVEDNGCGITKENLEKMKEPFFTTKIHGTGLGVSLSTEIVNLHGGKIVYDSKVNRGTKVTITLPKNTKKY